MIETFDDRHDCDNGGHTDHDAHQRQRRAQFVGAQTPSGDAKRFPDRREPKYVTQSFASEKHERHKTKGQIEFSSFILCYFVPLRGSLPDSFVFFDLSVANGDNAVGARGDVVLVRDHNDRVAFRVQTFEEVHDLHTGVRSSAPVGSSASRIDGWFTRARAMATRWR